MTSLVPQELTGTATLLRLALRRDRIRLAVWPAALTLLMAYTPSAMRLAYPDEAQRIARVALMKTPAAIMLAGPTFGVNETDLGAMIANELMLTMIVAASILAVLTVVRHTRADEERGTAELVAAAAVGRHARTGAALALAGGVNAVLAAALTIALAANGFAVADCAAMSLGIAAVAMVFAAVAAVTAQLWRQARAAGGAALAALAAAVVVRGLGDIIDHSGSALSWCSPIAWAQQLRPFVALRWWPLAPLLVLTVVLIALAAALERRRQYGAGVLPGTGDRPRARRIGGVFALHLRLHRGQTVGWAVGMLLGGLAIGSMTRSMLDMAVGNDLVARMLGERGADGMYSAMLQLLTATAGGCVVAAVLRVYRDEASGLGEPVLAAAVSRWRWLCSAVAAAVVAGAVTAAAAGFGMGLGAALTMRAPEQLWRLTLAGLTFVPALAVLAGIAAVAVALRRPVIAWSVLALVVAALYLGALLGLPQWLLELSPFVRIRSPLAWSPAAWAVTAVVAVALTVAAAAAFRRRDHG